MIIEISPFIPGSPIEGLPVAAARKRVASDLRLVRSILRETYDRLGSSPAERHDDFAGACMAVVAQSYGLNLQGTIRLISFLNSRKKNYGYFQ